MSKIFIALIWVAIALFLSLLGYTSYEIVKDSTSLTVPQTIEGRIDLEKVSGRTYLPEDIKYFSIYQNGGWIINFDKTDSHGVRTTWSFISDYPGKNLTIYRPLQDSFRIENNNLLFTWEHQTGGLIWRIAIAVLLGLMLIVVGVIVSKVNIYKNQNK